MHAELKRPAAYPSTSSQVPIEPQCQNFEAKPQSCRIWRHQRLRCVSLLSHRHLLTVPHITNVHHTLHNAHPEYYQQLNVFYHSHSLDFSPGCIKVSAVSATTQPFGTFDLLD